MIKNKIIIYLGVALQILAVICFFSIKANVKKGTKIDVLTENIVASQARQIFWKNSYNKRVVEKETIVLDYRKLQNSNDALIQQAEKLRKDLNIKTGKIEYVNVETVKVDTQFVTKKNDTCYFYKDDWNDISFCTKMSSININDTTTTILHINKYIPNPSKIFFIRWFQKKQEQYLLDIQHANPLLKTTDLKTIIKPE